jgi:hypothetical protein
MKLIARFSNHRDGVEGRVYRKEDGRLFVVLFDLDAWEAVPTARTFKPAEIDSAHDYAKKIACI